MSQLVCGLVLISEMGQFSVSVWISPVSEKISAVQPVSVRLVSELQRNVNGTRDEDFTCSSAASAGSAVRLGAISKLWLLIKTLSEVVQWVLVTVVRPVARRRLVEFGNPSACATVNCNVHGIAIVLYVSVIKSGCNRRANKI
jgi:hypothetical protein